MICFWLVIILMTIEKQNELVETDKNGEFEFELIESELSFWFFFLLGTEIFRLNSIKILLFEPIWFDFVKLIKTLLSRLIEWVPVKVNAAIDLHRASNIGDCQRRLLINENNWLTWTRHTSLARTNFRVLFLSLFKWRNQLTKKRQVSI